MLHHVQVDLGEVELRGVPAADAVVGAEVALDLEVVRRRGVPLHGHAHARGRKRGGDGKERQLE